MQERSAGVLETRGAEPPTTGDAPPLRAINVGLSTLERDALDARLEIHVVVDDADTKLTALERPPQLLACQAKRGVPTARTTLWERQLAVAPARRLEVAPLRVG